MKIRIAPLISTALLLSFISLVSMAQTQAPAPVTEELVGGKSILADRNHMTVYVYDPDVPGLSNCAGNCARAWPPVVLLPQEQVAAPFGFTVRGDGSRQILFQNHPIYNYIGDQKAGDIIGDGIGGIWHIIPFKSVASPN